MWSKRRRRQIKLEQEAASNTGAPGEAQANNSNNPTLAATLSGSNPPVRLPGKSKIPDGWSDPGSMSDRDGSLSTDVKGSD